MSRKISIAIAMIVSGWFVAAWVFGQETPSDFVLEAPVEEVISPDAVLQSATLNETPLESAPLLAQPTDTLAEEIPTEVETDGFLLEEDFKPLESTSETEADTPDLELSEPTAAPAFDGISPSDQVASEEISVGSGNVYEFSDEAPVDNGVQNTFVPPAPTTSFELSVDSEADTTPQNLDLTNTSHAPQISITTHGPSEIRINEAAEYRITVINRGNNSAKNVFVTIQLPEWVTIVSTASQTGETETLDVGDGLKDVQWTVSNLAMGSQTTWDLKLIPTKSKQFAFNAQWTIAPAPVALDIQVVEPHLELALDGPSEMEFGDTEVVTVRLTNSGNTIARNVKLVLQPGIENGQVIGDIEAGRSKLIELELSAEQSGTMQIRTLASADNLKPVSKDLIVDVKRAELNIALEGPEKRFAGTPTVYRIETSNTGDTAARDVVVTATLPLGASFMKDGVATKGDRRSMSWNIGKVDAGATRAFEFECVLARDGENPVHVRIEGESAESRSTSLVTNVRGIADLKLLVNDSPGPVELGNLAIYEIEIVNRGTKAATDVQVVGQFGFGIEPVKTEGKRSELIPGQAIFDPIDSIGPGESIKLKVFAKADAAGSHKFRAVVQCAAPETKLVQEEMTVFLSDGDEEPVTLTAPSGEGE